MDTLLQDVRYALRMCVRTPGFTIVAIVALALGIGANATIFTVVNATLIEPLPYREPARLVALWETNGRRAGRPNTIGPANIIRWQERATSFERIAPYYDYRVNLTGGGAPEEIVTLAVTPDYFPALGVAPLAGRIFAPDEGPDGRDALAILSFSLWQRRFGGDPSIVGRSVQIDAKPVTIIGVMPAEARLFVSRGSLVGKPAELWMPFAFSEASRTPRGRYLSAIARIRPGVTVAQAQAELATIASGLSREFPAFDTNWSTLVVPIRNELSGDLRPTLLILFGAVGFVLLIACANVANLLLTRGAGRQREIAIRGALGAGRGRIARQLLTESLVLCTLGGAAGLLVAEWALSVLLAISPADLSDLGPVSLSYPVLAFTAAVSMLTAIACGVAPAFEGSRAAAQEALREGARQIGVGVRSRRIRQAFVVSELAFALVLLIGAGLTLRSLASLRGVNPGFDSHNVLTVRMTIPPARYPTDASRLTFFADAVSRIKALPGVESAGAISYLPLAGLGAATDFTIVGQPPPAPGQSLLTDVRVCDDGYFESMKVALRAGRLFSEREMREKSNVVIVNEALAQRYFPDGDALGKSLMISMTSPNVPTTIIGIVADSRFADIVTVPRAMTYWPHPQLAYSAMTLTVRTAGDPAAMVPLVEREVHAIDKDQPLGDVRTMDQWLARSLAQARFSSTLLSVFAGLALLLAAVGVYGVVAYAVTQRTSEIGIRLALGAEGRDIRRMIIGDAARLAGAGLGVGVVLALALGRVISSLLYETSKTDPLTFAAVVGILGAVAIAAGYIPARRASRIAPVEALRCQ
ncbi:MAG TPA: ABC transporter permease [Vicinamibacterales bacterium]|jgi:putative ABC transport system permease protein